MNKKIIKTVALLAVFGAAIGLAFAYFSKYKAFSDEVNADNDEFEDDDLDEFTDSFSESDKTSGRSYVTLN